MAQQRLRELESRLHDLVTEYADVIAPGSPQDGDDTTGWLEPTCTGLVLVTHWIDLTDDPHDAAHFVRYTRGPGLDVLGAVGLLTVALDTAREL